MNPITTLNPNERKTPEGLNRLFQSDEVLWFNDGRWGLAGYAIPNGQGKTWTVNQRLFYVTDLVGRALFHLAHRQEPYFVEPPHKDFWWDWHKALIEARRQLQTHRLAPGTTKLVKEGHTTANKQTFLVYPVPYFGTRIRQADIRHQIYMGLRMLGHAFQHSAADKDFYLSHTLVDVLVGYINQMLRDVATKYFGVPLATIEAAEPEYEIPAELFSSANYRPEDRIPSFEQSTERPPQLWRPTENDLSAINGVAYTDALHLADHWPVTNAVGEGDWETTLPGLTNRVLTGDHIDTPTSVPTDQANASGEYAPD